MALYVGSESLAVFVEREGPVLLGEGWMCHGDPKDVQAEWSPPWARGRRFRMDEAIRERNHLVMDAWVEADEPDDFNAFYAAWVTLQRELNRPS